MIKPIAFVTAVSLCTFSALPYVQANAQSGTQANVVAGPNYDSGAGIGTLSNSNFNTPESDGRPGVKYFTLAVQAVRKGDFAHAVAMYKVAASWAYKPAEYNLGVMYFKGEGVPADRPLGAAWMIMAAERGEASYSQARDMMVTLLSKPEFARTDELWGQLRQTYGDEVALTRAKARWAWVRTHQTGTRVGGATAGLKIGVMGNGHSPASTGQDGKPVRIATTSAEVMPSGSVDGSIAYRQMQQSNNPYSPVFLQNPTGTVVVKPLTPIDAQDTKIDQDHD